MKKTLSECPVCSGSLVVSRYTCHHCQTEISGKFEPPGPQWQLDQELMNFLKVFIFAEGNIKQSEKLLNCSYPKIKNLLKKTKVALGFEEKSVQNENSVISRLEKGEIDVDEALAQLKAKD